jgi:hypothetical protein
MGISGCELDEDDVDACLDGFAAQFLHLHRGNALEAMPAYVSNQQAWQEGAQLAQRLCEEQDLSAIAKIGYAMGSNARMWAARGVKLSAERDALRLGLGWFYEDAEDQWTRSSVPGIGACVASFSKIGNEGVRGMPIAEKKRVCMLY